MYVCFECVLGEKAYYRAPARVAGKKLVVERAREAVATPLVAFFGGFLRRAWSVPDVLYNRKATDTMVGLSRPP